MNIGIRDKKELRYAYGFLFIFKEFAKENPDKVTHRLRKVIVEKKREIRQYHKNNNRNEILVKDYGIDGYISLVALPESLKTAEDAENYFYAKLYKYSGEPGCGYDCTGQASTAWHKIIKRRGQFFVYHEIAYDV